MMAVAWCGFHAYQLIVKLVLLVLDEWKWDLSDLGEGPGLDGGTDGRGVRDMPTAYFSATATIANVWRDTGIPRKAKTKAESLWPDDAAAAHISTITPAVACADGGGPRTKLPRCSCAASTGWRPSSLRISMARSAQGRAEHLEPKRMRSLRGAGRTTG